MLMLPKTLNSRRKVQTQIGGCGTNYRVLGLVGSAIGRLLLPRLAVASDEDFGVWDLLELPGKLGWRRSIKALLSLLEVSGKQYKHIGSYTQVLGLQMLAVSHAPSSPPPLFTR